MKRMISLLLVMISLCAGVTMTAAALEIIYPIPNRPVDNNEITMQAVITLSQNQKDSDRLTDRDWHTVWRSNGNTIIRIHSQKPIGSMYIQWDQKPAAWVLSQPKSPSTNPTGTTATLPTTTSTTTTQKSPQVTTTTKAAATAEKQIAKSGKRQFLHEYLPLAETAYDITLTLPKGGNIGDLYLFGTDTVPRWVQQWQPALDKADLLVLPTHADDETLWFGGAIPYYAGERGLKVQIVYLTDHFKQLYRRHEVLDSMWNSGVTAYPIFDSPFPDIYSTSLDSARKNYEKINISESDVIEYQVQMIRRFQPEVVLGHDINGEYGHGQHRLNTDALCQALKVSGDAKKYPNSAKKYGVWKVSKCYLHLYNKNPIVMSWSEMPMASYNGKTALEVARDSFTYHVSQNKGKWAVKESGPYDCRKFGLYYTNVGLDVAKNDFFEHVVFRAASRPTTTVSKPQTQTTKSSGTSVTSGLTQAQTTRRPGSATTTTTATRLQTTTTTTQSVSVPSSTKTLQTTLTPSKTVTGPVLTWLLLAGAGVLVIAGGVTGLILLKRRH